ncbi:glycosyltransferase family 4 protein [Proteus mirabilis]|uniref:glycosyltransferase family 4 protein n=1 Tax=Proteus mirabilis TaxID=584 RepID=UPI001F037564|nr:glycosyltransferase family 4 protein [Proteus mirabilis]
MKKILIITSEYKISGPNNVIEALCHGFNEAKKQVDIIALRNKHDKNYIEKIEKYSHVHIKPKFIPSIIFFIYCCIKIQPDYINSHGIRADIYSFLLSKIFKKKYCATIHNIPFEDYTFRYSRIMAFFMLSVHKLVFRSKKIIKICVSEKIMHSLNNHGAQNTHFVYNGIIFNKYNKLDEYNRNKFCEYLNLDKNRKKTIFCGHLTKIKNPLLILVLAKKNPHIDFLVLGDGYLKKELENNKLNNIHIYGRVKNVKDYLSISNIFFMPSITEGMPMALIEALKIGLYPLCSNIDIFKELRKNLNLDLEIFNINDNQNLDIAFKKAMTKYEISNNNYIIKKHFSSGVMAKKYLEIFINA